MLELRGGIGRRRGILREVRRTSIGRYTRDAIGRAGESLADSER
ncbi:MAG TPA: hypothetical protein VEJ39_06605 [Candidatus Acidoferrales bacterium]|nr:hypothetical protein [Candidatus Acidoferrales bacterium]